MIRKFECVHCYEDLGLYYTFELKRYRDDTPRPICKSCAKSLIEFGELLNELINTEDEKPPK